MKALKGIIIAIVMTLVASTSFAAGSTDLTVQATVLGTCSFDAAAYTMNFGNLDPAAAVDTNATATLGFTCANGTAYTIDNIAGARTMTGTTDTLPYSIAAYATTGTGSGASQTVALTGTVLAADYDIASGTAAEAYSEVITININP
jgi:hypothetical protein